MVDEGLTNENRIEPEVAEAEDTEALAQALAEEKEKAGKYLANWQRAEADFINYRRRSEQEREEISQFARSGLILSLLPVLDDLARAFDAVPSGAAELNWLEGIKLIERKLRATLESQGLSPIEAVGKPFDPRLHEAVRQGEGQEGVVLEEVQKGYKFGDRVIRPSKVVVGNGEEPVEKEER